MMEPPTTADLIKACDIRDDQVNAAVTAVMGDPRIGRFAIADGLYLDLTRIIRRTGPATTMRDPTATEGLKRGVLRKAILLARPVRA